MGKALEDYTHVFSQNTPSKPPLVPTYNGPFRVLRKHIDQIKAAHSIQPVSDPTPVNQPQLDTIEECDVTSAITLPWPSTTPRPAQRDALAC